jgi:hypothetical protein
MNIDDDRRPRRYSEGQEHMPGLPASARVGCYADGLTVASDARTVRAGTYADGLVLDPGAPAACRIGTYADTFVPPVDTARMRPRLRVAHGRPHLGQA